jgi:hypothetical protein
VSDPQLAVFETAIADRQVIIVPILQSRSPTEHA